MSGFLGFGQSGQENTSNRDINNLYSWAIPTAQDQAASGRNELNSVFASLLPASSAAQLQSNANLGSASNYYNNLLTAGRTQTAQNASPAINSALASSDAQRRAEAVSGTGRTGGTAELNREQGATTASTIDNIINNTMLTGQQTGAQGLSNIGSEQMQQYLNLLGLGSNVGGTNVSAANTLTGIASSGEQSALGDAIAKEGSQTGAFGGLINTGAQTASAFGLAAALGLL